MTKSKGIDPFYYEENSLADEFEEAARNGALLRPRNGKNAIEVMQEYARAKAGPGFSETAASASAPAFEKAAMLAVAE